MSTTTRASKFKPAVREAILDALRKGLPIRHACALGGIDASQFYRWMERGKTSPEESTWHQFYMDVERAIAEAVSPRVTRITQAAIDGDWRADAWMLERRFPNEFGARERPSAPTGPIVVELSLPGGPALTALPSSQVEVGRPEAS